MKITLDMFKLLCALCQLHPRYLSLIDGMGLKSGLDDEHFMTCYHHLEEAGIMAKHNSNFGSLLLLLLLDGDGSLTNLSLT